MERACLYDIEVKFALGLRLDERPFDHSSLGDFRKRLLDNGQEKEVFDRILKHLVEATQTFIDRKKNLKMFHFPMSCCDGCPRQSECTNAKEGRRTVGISEFNEELRDAEVYNGTEAFKADMKLGRSFPTEKGDDRIIGGVLRRSRDRDDPFLGEPFPAHGLPSGSSGYAEKIPA